ncbi:hypothetical protein N7G274_006579 [Stereocaulon virgatum]|uniref:Uncharacterized protein n=1 Tax=Stereocaulon virgatum TaxID=373712 RepID=A0ABR4A578_9LECA
MDVYLSAPMMYSTRAVLESATSYILQLSTTSHREILYQSYPMIPISPLQKGKMAERWLTIQQYQQTHKYKKKVCFRYRRSLALSSFASSVRKEARMPSTT